MVLMIVETILETDVIESAVWLAKTVIALRFMVAWFRAQRFGDNPTTAQHGSP